jgi:formylglycine-generating enzyme required for sulfatase activity
LKATLRPDDATNTSQLTTAISTLGAVSAATRYNVDDKHISGTVVGFIRSTLLTLAIFTPAIAQGTETRIALVIGNSAYSIGPLPNPANDAVLIESALQSVGFKVKRFVNADQNEMKRAIKDFGARLESAGPDAVGLFYYAGHGVQLNGRNYLIPTKASIERAGDVEIEAVSADWVLAQMRNAPNSLNIVILDACRNNPFTRSMRGLEHGLANMDAPTGTLIEFSTAPGEVAADGSGQNSPYSKSLAEAMHERKPVEQVFKRVRKEVMTETAGKQVPWEQSSLIGDFYFATPGKDVLEPSKGPAEKPNMTVATVLPASKPEGGSFGAWLNGLVSRTKPEAGTVTAAASPIPGARALPVLKSLGIRVDGIDAAHNYPQQEIRHLIESAPRQVTLGSTPQEIRQAFALCQKYSRKCQFSDYVDEGLRTVMLEPFELDPLPVSVGAFRSFASAKGYTTQAEHDKYALALLPTPKKVPGGSWRNGVRRHPEEDSTVVAVSFQDARRYCEANGSRLPTEDEWEYVARGPTRDIFPWGNSAADTDARSFTVAPHVTDGPDEGIGRRYKGLAGNVWQWVNTTVNANIEPECAQSKEGFCKVLKGGSWLEENPAYKRAATRRYELPERAYEDSGFRCARPVPAWPDAGIWLTKLQ